jgi:hypothetical protein
MVITNSVWKTLSWHGIQKVSCLAMQFKKAVEQSSPKSSHSNSTWTFLHRLKIQLAYQNQPQAFLEAVAGMLRKEFYQPSF